MLSKKEVRLRNKVKLIYLFGGCCALCGYKRSYRGLEFHHINPKEKSFKIASGNIVSYVKLLEEAKKCVLLCSCCHSEVEDGLRVITKDVIEKTQKSILNEIGG